MGEPVAQVEFTYTRLPMRGTVGQLWGRDPIGYRQGDLTASDGVAVAAVTMVGGPALVVGTVMVTLEGLGLLQILLVAPIVAILGGLMIGASARMAASTGASSVWLLRPSFGRIGSRLVAVLRLIMIGLWAGVVLSLVGDWGADAAIAWGLGLSSAVVILAVAGLAFLMAIWGSRTIMVAIRLPLFIASIAIVAVAAMFVVQEGAPPLPGGGGSIWPGLERGIEMAAVFVPFVQLVARRITDDQNAAFSFGVGYVIPATVTIVLGAVFASQLGGWPVELIAAAPGATGAMFAVAWVVVSEVDQVFAGFVAGGSEMAGIVPGVAEWLLGLTASVAIVGAALVMGDDAIHLASLVTAVVFPAIVIAIADFFFSSDRYYSESDLYGAEAGRGSWNLIGLLCWLGAVVVGQWIDSMEPLSSVAAVAVPGIVDGPWRMVAALGAALVYLALTRRLERRGASVHELRGVGGHSLRR